MTKTRKRSALSIIIGLLLSVFMFSGVGLTNMTARAADWAEDEAALKARTGDLVQVINTSFWALLDDCENNDGWINSTMNATIVINTTTQYNASVVANIASAGSEVNLKTAIETYYNFIVTDVDSVAWWAGNLGAFQAKLAAWKTGLGDKIVAAAKIDALGLDPAVPAGGLDDAIQLAIGTYVTTAAPASPASLSDAFDYYVTEFINLDNEIADLVQEVQDAKDEIDILFSTIDLAEGAFWSDVDYYVLWADEYAPIKAHYDTDHITGLRTPLNSALTAQGANTITWSGNGTGSIGTLPSDLADLAAIKGLLETYEINIGNVRTYYKNIYDMTGPTTWNTWYTNNVVDDVFLGDLSMFELNSVYTTRMGVIKLALRDAIINLTSPTAPTALVTAYYNGTTGTLDVLQEVMLFADAQLVAIKTRAGNIETKIGAPFNQGYTGGIVTSFESDIDDVIAYFSDTNIPATTAGFVAFNSTVDGMMDAAEFDAAIASLIQFVEDEEIAFRGGLHGTADAWYTTNVTQAAAWATFKTTTLPGAATYAAAKTLLETNYAVYDSAGDLVGGWLEVQRQVPILLSFFYYRLQQISEFEAAFYGTLDAAGKAIWDGTGGRDDLWYKLWDDLGWVSEDDLYDEIVATNVTTSTEILTILDVYAEFDFYYPDDTLIGGTLFDLRATIELAAAIEAAIKAIEDEEEYFRTEWDDADTWGNPTLLDSNGDDYYHWLAEGRYKAAITLWWDEDYLGQIEGATAANLATLVGEYNTLLEEIRAALVSDHGFILDVLAFVNGINPGFSGTAEEKTYRAGLTWHTPIKNNYYTSMATPMISAIWTLLSYNNVTEDLTAFPTFPKTFMGTAYANLGLLIAAYNTERDAIRGYYNNVNTLYDGVYGGALDTLTDDPDYVTTLYADVAAAYESHRDDLKDALRAALLACIYGTDDPQDLIDAYWKAGTPDDTGDLADLRAFMSYIGDTTDSLISRAIAEELFFRGTPAYTGYHALARAWYESTAIQPAALEELRTDLLAIAIFNPALADAIFENYAKYTAGDLTGGALFTIRAILSEIDYFLTVYVLDEYAKANNYLGDYYKDIVDTDEWEYWDTLLADFQGYFTNVLENVILDDFYECFYGAAGIFRIPAALPADILDMFFGEYFFDGDDRDFDYMLGVVVGEHEEMIDELIAAVRAMVELYEQILGYIESDLYWLEDYAYDWLASDWDDLLIDDTYFDEDHFQQYYIGWITAFLTRFENTFKTRLTNEFKDILFSEDYDAIVGKIGTFATDFAAYWTNYNATAGSLANSAVGGNGYNEIINGFYDEIDDLIAAVIELKDSYDKMLQFFDDFAVFYEGQLRLGEFVTYELMYYFKELGFLAPEDNSFWGFVAPAPALDPVELAKYIEAYFGAGGVLMSEVNASIIQSLYEANMDGVELQVIEAAIDLFLEYFDDVVNMFYEMAKAKYGEQTILDALDEHFGPPPPAITETFEDLFNLDKTAFENWLRNGDGNFKGFTGDVYEILTLLGNLEIGGLVDFDPDVFDAFMGLAMFNLGFDTIGTTLGDFINDPALASIFVAGRRDVLLAKIAEIHSATIDYTGTMYESWFDTMKGTYTGLVWAATNLTALDKIEEQLDLAVQALVDRIENLEIEKDIAIEKLQRIVDLFAGFPNSATPGFVTRMNNLIRLLNLAEREYDIWLIMNDADAVIENFINKNGDALLKWLVDRINDLPDLDDVRYEDRDEIFDLADLEDLLENTFGLSLKDEYPDEYDKLYDIPDGYVYRAERIYVIWALWDEDYCEVEIVTDATHVYLPTPHIADAEYREYYLEDHNFTFKVTINVGYNFNSVEVYDKYGNDWDYDDDYTDGADKEFNFTLDGIAVNWAEIDVLTDPEIYYFIVQTVVVDGTAYAAQPPIAFEYKKAAGGAFFLPTYEGGYDAEIDLGVNWTDDYVFDGYRLDTLSGPRITEATLFSEGGLIDADNKVYIVARFVAINGVKPAEMYFEDVYGVDTSDRYVGGVDIRYSDVMADAHPSTLEAFIRRPNNNAARFSVNDFDHAAGVGFATSSGLYYGDPFVANYGINFGETALVADIALENRLDDDHYEYTFYWYDNAGNLVAVSTIIIDVEKYETYNVTFYDDWRGIDETFEVLATVPLSVQTLFKDSDPKLNVEVGNTSLVAGHIFGAWVEVVGGAFTGNFLYYEENAALTYIAGNSRYEARWFELESLGSGDFDLLSPYGGHSAGSGSGFSSYLRIQHTGLYTGLDLILDDIQNGINYGALAGAGHPYNDANIDALYYGAFINTPDVDGNPADRALLAVIGYGIDTNNTNGMFANGLLTAGSYGGENGYFLAIPFATFDGSDWIFNYDDLMQAALDNTNPLVGKEEVGGDEYFVLHYIVVFTDADIYGNAYQFNLLVKIYNEYTLSFDPDNGDALFSDVVAYGDTYTAPIYTPAADPTLSHYEFKGWFFVDEYGNEEEFILATHRVYKDYDLYAKWEVSELKIDYYVDGAIEDTVYVAWNAADDYKIPENPELELWIAEQGYAFDGWRWMANTYGFAPASRVHDGNDTFDTADINPTVEIYAWIKLYGDLWVDILLDKAGADELDPVDLWTGLGSYADVTAAYPKTVAIIDYNDVVDFQDYYDNVQDADTHFFDWWGYTEAYDDLTTLYLRIRAADINVADGYSLTYGGHLFEKGVDTYEEAGTHYVLIYVPFATWDGTQWVAVGDGYRATRNPLAGVERAIYWYEFNGTDYDLLEAERGEIRFMDYQEVNVTLRYTYKTDVKTNPADLYSDPVAWREEPVRMLHGNSATQLEGKIDDLINPPSNKIEKDGYTVDHWEISYRRGTGDDFFDVGPAAITMTTTLYAVFTNDEFTVNLMSIDPFTRALPAVPAETFAGAQIGPVQRFYDDYLLVGTPYWLGYRFVGWTTEGDPTQWTFGLNNDEPDPDSFVDNLTTHLQYFTAQSPITLYAFFVPNTYIVIIENVVHAAGADAQGNIWTNGKTTINDVVFDTELEDWYDWDPMNPGSALDPYAPYEIQTVGTTKYIFDGWWYVELDDDMLPIGELAEWGTRADVETIKGNIRIYAHWVSFQALMLGYDDPFNVTSSTTAITVNYTTGALRGFLEDFDDIAEGDFAAKLITTIDKRVEIVGADLFAVITVSIPLDSWYMLDTDGTYANYGLMLDEWKTAGIGAKESTGSTTIRVKIGEITAPGVYDFEVTGLDPVWMFVGNEDGDFLYSAHDLSIIVTDYLEHLKSVFANSWNGYIKSMVLYWRSFVFQNADVLGLSSMMVWSAIGDYYDAYGVSLLNPIAGATHADMIAYYNGLVDIVNSLSAATIKALEYLEEEYAKLLPYTYSHQNYMGTGGLRDIYLAGKNSVLAEKLNPMGEAERIVKNLQAVPTLWDELYNYKYDVEYGAKNPAGVRVGGLRSEYAAIAAFYSADPEVFAELKNYIAKLWKIILDNPDDVPYSPSTTVTPWNYAGDNDLAAKKLLVNAVADRARNFIEVYTYLRTAIGNLRTSVYSYGYDLDLSIYVKALEDMWDIARQMTEENEALWLNPGEIKAKYLDPIDAILGRAQAAVKEYSDTIVDLFIKAVNALADRDVPITKANMTPQDRVDIIAAMVLEDDLTTVQKGQPGIVVAQAKFAPIRKLLQDIIDIFEDYGKVDEYIDFVKAAGMPNVENLLAYLAEFNKQVAFYNELLDVNNFYDDTDPEYGEYDPLVMRDVYNEWLLAAGAFPPGISTMEGMWDYLLGAIEFAFDTGFVNDLLDSRPGFILLENKNDAANLLTEIEDFVPAPAPAMVALDTDLPAPAPADVQWIADYYLGLANEDLRFADKAVFVYLFVEWMGEGDNAANYEQYFSKAVKDRLWEMYQYVLHIFVIELDFDGAVIDTDILTKLVAQGATFLTGADTAADEALGIYQFYFDGTPTFSFIVNITDQDASRRRLSEVQLFDDGDNEIPLFNDPLVTTYQNLDTWNVTWTFDFDDNNKIIFRHRELQWVVSFDSNWVNPLIDPDDPDDHVPMPQAYVTNEGDTVSRPAEDPTCTSGVFQNWYEDAACTVLFKFTVTQIEEDTTIYALWDWKKFDVTVDFGDGNTWFFPQLDYDTILGSMFGADPRGLVAIIPNHELQDNWFEYDNINGTFYFGGNLREFVWDTTPVRRDLYLKLRWVEIRDLTFDDIEIETYGGIPAMNGFIKLEKSDTHTALITFIDSLSENYNFGNNFNAPDMFASILHNILAVYEESEAGGEVLVWINGAGPGTYIDYRYNIMVLIATEAGGRWGNAATTEFFFYVEVWDEDGFKIDIYNFSIEVGPYVDYKIEYNVNNPDIGGTVGPDYVIKNGSAANKLGFDSELFENTAAQGWIFRGWIVGDPGDFDTYDGTIDDSDLFWVFGTPVPAITQEYLEANSEALYAVWRRAPHTIEFYQDETLTDLIGTLTVYWGFDVDFTLAPDYLDLTFAQSEIFIWWVFDDADNNDIPTLFDGENITKDWKVYAWFATYDYLAYDDIDWRTEYRGIALDDVPENNVELLNTGEFYAFDDFGIDTGVLNVPIYAIDYKTALGWDPGAGYTGLVLSVQAYLENVNCLTMTEELANYGIHDEFYDATGFVIDFTIATGTPWVAKGDGNRANGYEYLLVVRADVVDEENGLIVGVWYFAIALMDYQTVKVHFKYPTAPWGESDYGTYTMDVIYGRSIDFSGDKVYPFNLEYGKGFIGWATAGTENNLNPIYIYIDGIDENGNAAPVAVFTADHTFLAAVYRLTVVFVDKGDEIVDPDQRQKVAHNDFAKKPAYVFTPETGKDEVYWTLVAPEDWGDPTDEDWTPPAEFDFLHDPILIEDSNEFAEVTLYAYYLPNTILVVFMNDAVMQESQNVYYDTYIEQPAKPSDWFDDNSDLKVFVGWWTKAVGEWDEEVIFENGWSIDRLTAVTSGTYTLYARFVDITELKADSMGDYACDLEFGAPTKADGLYTNAHKVPPFITGDLLDILLYALNVTPMPTSQSRTVYIDGDKVKTEIANGTLTIGLPVTQHEAAGDRYIPIVGTDGEYSYEVLIIWYDASGVPFAAERFEFRVTATYYKALENYLEGLVAGDLADLEKINEIIAELLPSVEYFEDYLDEDVLDRFYQWLKDSYADILSDFVKELLLENKYSNETKELITLMLKTAVVEIQTAATFAKAKEIFEDYTKRLDKIIVDIQDNLIKQLELLKPTDEKYADFEDEFDELIAQGKAAIRAQFTEPGITLAYIDAVTAINNLINAIDRAHDLEKAKEYALDYLDVENEDGFWKDVYGADDEDRLDVYLGLIEDMFGDYEAHIETLDTPEKVEAFLEVVKWIVALQSSKFEAIDDILDALLFALAPAPALSPAPAPIVFPEGTDPRLEAVAQHYIDLINAAGNIDVVNNLKGQALQAIEEMKGIIAAADLAAKALTYDKLKYDAPPYSVAPYNATARLGIVIGKYTDLLKEATSMDAVNTYGQQGIDAIAALIAEIEAEKDLQDAKDEVLPLTYNTAKYNAVPFNTPAYDAPAKFGALITTHTDYINAATTPAEVELRYELWLIAKKNLEKQLDDQKALQDAKDEVLPLTYNTAKYDAAPFDTPAYDAPAKFGALITTHTGLINAATTIAQVDLRYSEWLVAKQNLEKELDAQKDLADAKRDAKATLTYDEFKYADYEDDFTRVIGKYEDLIDAATSVSEAWLAAQFGVDAIEDLQDKIDLIEYKKAAVKEVNDYVDEQVKEYEDYEFEASQFSDIVKNHTYEINNAANADLVDESLQAAKDRIDAQMQRLIAFAELKALDEEGKYGGIIDDYNNQINQAPDIETILRLLEEGLAKVQLAIDLDNAKEAAIISIKDEIESFVSAGTHSESDFAKLLRDYTDRINAATAIAAVDALLIEALGAIDDLADLITRNKGRIDEALTFDAIFDILKPTLREFIEPQDGAGVITALLATDRNAIKAELEKYDISDKSKEDIMVAVDTYVAAIERLDYSKGADAFDSDLENAKNGLIAALAITRATQDEEDARTVARMIELIASLGPRPKKEDLEAARNEFKALSIRLQNRITNAYLLDEPSNLKILVWVTIGLLIVLFALAIVILIIVLRKKGGGDDDDTSGKDELEKKRFEEIDNTQNTEKVSEPVTPAQDFAIEAEITEEEPEEEAEEEQEEEEEEDDEPEDAAETTESHHLEAFEIAAVAAAARGPRKPMTERLFETLTSQKFIYSALKNELLSYRNVKCRMTKSLEKFTIGREVIARISLVGKTLRLYLALNPASYEVKIYRHKDVSDKRKYEETPFLLKIKSERTLGRALSLITDIMIGKELTKRRKFDETDYVMMYRNKELTPLGRQGLGHLIVDEVTAGQTEVLGDSSAGKCVLVENAAPNAEPVKQVVELGVINDNFKSGETVDLKQLLRKKLVPVGTNYIKIGSDGSLNKVLTVVANSFAAAAVKMIALTGGLAVRLKSDDAM